MIMPKLTGLGRGLGALIPKKISSNIISDRNREALLPNDESKIMQIPVGELETNPMQPRQSFDHEGMEELVESIREHGIIQPLIVTRNGSGYQLIAGERRLRAAKILGLTAVPAIAREAKEQEKLELALIENVQRQNLNPIEKAYAYRRMMDEFNLSHEDVGGRLGISRPQITNTLRYLELPAAVQEALAQGKITEGHAKVIAGLATEKEQLALLQKILQYNFTVRDAENERQNFALRHRSKRALKDPMLEEKEDLLRSRLNTKVSIRRRGKQGQIIIEFYSDEELDEIISQILK